ncbi:hypothetical protein CGMCC3_g6525 [Colletotrichum fructicola]|nr:uncharacterized protein CGMCC3_g6525 [Colletotrichum fructicola]KAE9577591.1 hypothetical protein CGMCC3_g6525 [Colletotrichum fructicola]
MLRPAASCPSIESASPSALWMRQDAGFNCSKAQPGKFPPRQMIVSRFAHRHNNAFTQPPTRLLSPNKPVSPCCQAGPEHEIAAAFRGFEQSLEYARAACLIVNAGLGPPEASWAHDTMQ